MRPETIQAIYDQCYQDGRQVKQPGLLLELNRYDLEFIAGTADNGLEYQINDGVIAGREIAERSKEHEERV